jgi:hypothetical protein
MTRPRESVFTAVVKNRRASGASALVERICRVNGLESWLRPDASARKRAAAGKKMAPLAASSASPILTRVFLRFFMETQRKKPRGERASRKK